ncbi:carboxylate-amine ligase [Yinghuangia soli]|uniref:Putative glutamate--cysteine ligase 2 n=1 Tax=Yinghuangia soli TaxID=2908204 RepID=A0AA41PWF9_9ACTN|nr:glutamate--cysteine ligase [Yinghuangia soli]MCF2527183.1 glutamate--cysteine ligase [Yinghuangia soli]
MHVRMGVEEEFHVIDASSGLLVPEAPALSADLPAETFTGEFQLSVIESRSGVHSTLGALREDLAAIRGTLVEAASEHGLAVVAAGTVPLVRGDSLGFAADERSAKMADEYQAVAEEQLICGAQVHIDIPDRDTAVRAMPVVSPWLSVLLALSASSPFWQGADTGYASWRTMLWQRWPTAGPAGVYRSAAEYDAAVRALVRTRVISDPGMVYSDVRPSDHVKTLELRICDACPDIGTVVLIAGLFRALVVDACRAVDSGDPPAPAPDGWLRAASWRAARSGLEGDLLDPSTGAPAPAGQVVRSLLARLRPTLEAFGDWEAVTAAAEAMLTEGSVARRLRNRAAGASWREVALALADSTRGGASAPATRATSSTSEARPSAA